MTDEQIMKALECCGKGFGNCEGCPYDDENNDCVTMDGRTLIFQNAIDLINRQRAEIEELTADCEKYKAERDEFANHIGRIREMVQSEAIKEFWDKAKQTREFRTCPYVYISDGDNLVEELTE